MDVILYEEFLQLCIVLQYIAETLETEGSFFEYGVL